MNSEKIRLKHNFPLFQEMWKNQELTDVHIFTQDSPQAIQGHRIVLASLSVTFKSALSGHECGQQQKDNAIFLNGFHHADVLYIVMYGVEVPLDNSRLPQIIEACADLGIELYSDILQEETKVSAWLIEANTNNPNPKTFCDFGIQVTQNDSPYTPRARNCPLWQWAKMVLFKVLQGAVL